MPELARFYGIIIRMFSEPSERHHVPHFHAYCGEYVAVFSISPVALIIGFPRSQVALGNALVREALLPFYTPLTQESVNLPNAVYALVDRGKVIDYLLAPNHPEGASKAGFFTRFGFVANRWQVLVDALRVHASAHAITSTSETKHGTKYCVDGPLLCPDGRTPRLRTVWIIDVDTETPRLVTAYPL